MTAADRPSVTDNDRDEEQSGYTVQQTAAHFARCVQRVSDRIRSADYQRSVSDIVALDNVEGFLDRIARDDLDVFAAGRAEAERPACTWPRCKSPATGKCFAWCKCICHEWSAAHRAAGRAETTTATTEDMTTRLAAAEAELDRLCNGGRFTMSIPAREGYDSDLLIQASLSDLRGLLATARTRPTREQIIDALVMSPLSDTAGTDMRPFEQTADAVLALLADQPDPADVWDQGYAAGKNDLRDGTPFRTFNPYRGGAR